MVHRPGQGAAPVPGADCALLLSPEPDAEDDEDELPAPVADDPVVESPAATMACSPAPAAGRAGSLTSM
jgi:hypothetical protein